MSVVQNIQGTLTQTQELSQLNQQQVDQARTQALAGQIASEQAEEVKRNTIGQTDESDMGLVGDGENEKGQKRHPRKKTLPPLPAESVDLGGESARGTGILLNTLA